MTGAVRRFRAEALLALLVGVTACGPADSTDADPGVAADGTAEDWRIVRETLAWAWDAELERRPIGQTMVEIGQSFLGTTYTPATLEVDGPERLVVNLRELDCVTFVENVLALSRMVHLRDRSVLDSEAGLQSEYRAFLTAIRYRGGVLDGYPSRLHYFSEWIADNQARGLLRDVTREMGGVADPAPIDFMTTHTDAYRQLTDPDFVGEIARVEARLSGVARYYVPQDRIESVADRIQDGDVIAATSTVPGLDVAHTGIAVRHNGRVHLMHAPLVGSEVQVSETPIAERIQGIAGQDGIMVARPATPVESAAAHTSAPTSGG